MTMGFLGRAMIGAAVLAGAAHCSLADSVTLGALKDTSIYDNNAENTAGGNDVIFIAQNNNGATRRALVQFDIAASGIPPGSTIDSATVTLHIAGWTGSGAFGSDRTVLLHRLTNDWGNGTTVATSGGGGQGAQSVLDGDVSWTYRSWSSTDPAPPHLAWTAPGGDYDATASASLVISDSPTAVELDDPFAWAAAGMTADVQAWLDGSLPNNGWLIREAELADGLLIRFYSSEIDTAALRPMLSIEYTPVPEPGTIVLVAVGAMLLGTRRRRRAIRCR